MRLNESQTRTNPDRRNFFPVDFSVKSLLYVWDYVYLKLMKTETFVN